MGRGMLHDASHTFGCAHRVRTRRGSRMRTLEVRRHASRDPEADRLSEEGRAGPVRRRLARGVRGRVHLPQRAAETVAWFLRGLGEQLPRTPSCRPRGQGQRRLAARDGRRALGFARRRPRGRPRPRGLAHPLIERAVPGSRPGRSSRSSSARASCCPRPRTGHRSRSRSSASRADPWTCRSRSRGLGVALGASPGPVQLLLFSEASRGGVRRGCSRWPARTLPSALTCCCSPPGCRRSSRARRSCGSCR